MINAPCMITAYEGITVREDHRARGSPRTRGSPCERITARERITANGGRSPAGRERAALLETGAGLHADDGALGELLQGGRARVGAGAAHARRDVVEQVLDAGSLRVEVHPRGRDPLLEERFARAVEAAVTRGPGGHGTRRRHPVALLVGAALLVEHQVARALVGPGEPRPDH